jgi:DNA-binding transcriptional ArsR family regulator
MATVQERTIEAAALFKTLANEHRLLRLWRLLDGPRSVGDINERAPPAIT